MKILNIIQCANLGGMEQSALDSMWLLRDAGHDVRMLSLRPDGGLGPLAEEKGIALKAARKYSFFGLGGIPWLLREIKRFNPDRILLTGHNFGSLLASRISGRYTYLSIHFHHGDRKHLLWKIFYALAKRTCRGIHFVTRYIHNEVAPLLKGYANAICFPIVFWPAETVIDKSAARIQLHIPADAYVVGNAGWLIQRKAFDVFLNVAAMVKEKIPSAYFVIAGDGDLRTQLEQQAAHLGIGDSVRFLGWQRDMDPFYCSLDVLLFNSNFDALGRTPVEALCHGIPVVASVVNGGLEEFIRHGQDGFLINEHRPALLSEEIFKLYVDPAYRADRVGSGRSRVLEMGSPSRHVECMSKLMELS